MHACLWQEPKSKKPNPRLGAAQAATQETLKRLSLETLMAVLQSDNLRVPSEMHVFHSVLTWLEADPSRKSVAAQVRAS